MTQIRGDDGYGLGSGYGVLGTGTPLMGGENNDEPINSVGVWGLLGTDQSISDIIDEVTSNPGSPGIQQPVNAAVAARNALSSGGVAVYGESREFLAFQTSIGFLAGGDGTGVFCSGNFGLRAESTNGVAAIQGQSFGSALAGKFVGNVEVMGNVE